MRPILAVPILAAIALTGCDAADARTSSADPPAGTSAADRAPATAAPAQSRAATIDYGFTRGDADAPIKVVEFSDFGCPYCARFARATLPTLTEEYIDQGTVRWRYVPVVFGFPGGEMMGSAALCAAQQGGDDMFWRVHDLFYTRQAALRNTNARPAMLEWLGELGLDTAGLQQCMGNPSTRGLLERHTETAAAWYVRGTPTFVVNGVPMSGAVPADFFRKVFATIRDPSGL